MTAAVPLVAEDVSVSFGGVHALRNVSLEVRTGEIVGLIGGNGAGKTTFMDCVSGYVEATGSLHAFGTDITALAPELRPYCGIVRSFQDARLYPGLTVTETLLVAAERQRPTPLFGSLLNLGARRVEQHKRDLVADVVGTLGLDAYRDKRIRELSTGTRRVVDIATVVVQEPQLVLLDEPTSGLAQRETEAFGPLLRWLRERLDCAVLLIEHDIPLITSVSDRLYAFEAGTVIAHGSPSDVIADDRVVSSYLGTDDNAIRRSGAVAAKAPRPTRPKRTRVS